MLSEDLRNMANKLANAGGGGALLLSECQVTALCRMLSAAAADARALEAAVVPPPARLQGRDLPANVVAIAGRLHRQGVTLGMPGGGDAA